LAEAHCKSEKERNDVEQNARFDRRGGGAGLTCSMLLSTLGVEHILVSALRGTSILPKAHVLNQRTMEILGDAGVAEKIYAKSTPAENMRYMGWYAGFKGPDPDMGHRISRVESWGCGYDNLNWVQASACRSANLPQIRLEPLMKERAEELNAGKVRFHHELVGLEQDGDGVDARIVNNDSGDEYTVRARYVLGCDGGRTIPKMIGIVYEGRGVLFQTATAHVSADLSKLAPDPNVLIRWIWCPAISELAVLVPMGPNHWSPDGEEWVFHVSYQGEGPKNLTDRQIEDNMRAALGIGDLPMTIHKITRWSRSKACWRRGSVKDASSWSQMRRIAIRRRAAWGSAFRTRITCVGRSRPFCKGRARDSLLDSAHNLCWKIAAVLQGEGAGFSTRQL
jgi:2,4-dichlorophenol 6-monooxygenase